MILTLLGGHYSDSEIDYNDNGVEYEVNDTDGKDTALDEDSLNRHIM